MNYASLHDRDLQIRKLPQAGAVRLPVLGAGGWYARVAVEIYAGGVGIAPARDPFSPRASHLAFEVETPVGVLVVDPVAAHVTDRFVVPVERNVAAIGLPVQAIDQENAAELIDGHDLSPVIYRTAILALPAGQGKSAVAAAMRRNLSFRDTVDEWAVAPIVRPGCLHITNDWRGLT